MICCNHCGARMHQFTTADAVFGESICFVCKEIGYQLNDAERRDVLDEYDKRLHQLEQAQAERKWRKL